MPDNPISNSGVSPTQPPPRYGPDKPGLGADEMTQEKPFSLAPEGGKVTPETQPPEHPSPMEAAGDSARQQQPPMAPEVLSSHVVKLQDQLNTLQENLQSP